MKKYLLTILIVSQIALLSSCNSSKQDDTNKKERITDIKDGDYKGGIVGWHINDSSVDSSLAVKADVRFLNFANSTIKFQVNDISFSALGQFDLEQLAETYPNHVDKTCFSGEITPNKDDSSSYIKNGNNLILKHCAYANTKDLNNIKAFTAQYSIISANGETRDSGAFYFSPEAIKKVSAPLEPGNHEGKNIDIKSSASSTVQAIIKTTNSNDQTSGEFRITSTTNDTILITGVFTPQNINNNIFTDSKEVCFNGTSSDNKTTMQTTMKLSSCMILNSKNTDLKSHITIDGNTFCAKYTLLKIDTIANLQEVLSTGITCFSKTTP